MTKLFSTWLGNTLLSVATQLSEVEASASRA